MKLGIIGAGMIVTDFLSFAPTLKDTKLVGICTTKRSEAKAKEIKETYHFDFYTTDYQMLLDCDQIDTIYVALPNHLHYEYAKRALLFKKHVILEKPFTSTYQEAYELVALSKQNQCLLMEAITTQYLPNYKAIKEMLPALGNIKIVVCNYSKYSSRYDAFKKGEILPAFDYQKSGGALMDLNLYNIHFVVGLFGKPKQVTYLPNKEKGIDTSGILTLCYDSFQCVCIGAKDCNGPLANSIQGDKACLYVTTPLSTLKQVELFDHKGSVTNIDSDSKKHHMYYEFVAFEKMIRENDQDKVNQMLEHTLLVCKVLQQARKSGKVEFLADKKEQCSGIRNNESISR